MKNNNESVFFRYTEGMRKEDLPDTIFHLAIDKSVKRIPKKMFYERWELRTVEFEGELEAIEDFAFFDCTDLEYVYVNAKYIGESAFDSCNNLTDVKFGTSVEYIGYDAFANCNIHQITFANIDNCKCIERGAFQRYVDIIDNNLRDEIIKKFGYNCFKETYFEIKSGGDDKFDEKYYIKIE